MENKYTADISDFAKFLIFKNLLNNRQIGVVWYLVPDRNDPEYTFKFKVSSNNPQIYEYASMLDKNMAMQFNIICKKEPDRFYVKKLESMEILNNITYFNECIVGAYADGRDYRKVWLNRAVNKIKECDVVYLDPDYGLPIDYRISILKPLEKLTFPERYITIEEIREFFLGKDILIFHNRYPVGIEYNKVHFTIFKRMRKEFSNRFCYIIKLNAFLPRFFVILSRYNLNEDLKKFLITKNMCSIKPFKGFFTLILSEQFQ